MKTVGPFTGRQLTTIIVALIIGVVALPAGAWALTFTNVAITDPGGVNQAKVSAGGALSVSGTAVPATPANLVSIVSNAFENACTVAYPIPAGKALVLTAMTSHVQTASGTSQGWMQLSWSKSGSCTFNTFAFAFGGPSSAQGYVPEQTSFGSGKVIPSGATIMVRGVNASAVFELHGYLVPASAVPAAAAASSAPNATVVP